MLRTTWVGVGVVLMGVVGALAACDDEGTSTSGGGGASSTGATSSSKSTGVSGSTTSASGTSTGATGSSGSTSGSGSSTSASGSSSTTTSSGSSSSSSTGGGPGTDHVVITEIATSPAPAEFIEIQNLGAAPVDLSHYYLSDNAVYYGIAPGTPWNPPTSNPGTDFLVQFPPGTVIAPGAALVIAGNKTFENTYAKCPDLILDTVAYTCANGTAAPMIVPANGGLDPTKQGTLLADSREMVVLFTWDGVSGTVKDVDYVTWGTTFDLGATRADKTGVAGYQPDTPPAMQKPAPAPQANQSIERCLLEMGETSTGGNGLTGHDETSEPLDVNFAGQPAPTPGVKNGCLP
ncbi:MAG: lamin tail domain-containing protein [Polyangiaceae bacterium]